MYFKYCPICRNKLSQTNKNLFICKKNNHHIYINPRPTNAVIFENNDEEILMVKRNREPKNNFWDLPGGFVDLGETMEESVKREIKEELKINLKDFSYFGSYHGRYLYGGENYYTLCSIFISKLPFNVFRPNDEFSEIRFFKKKAIPFKRIAFKDVKDALKDYVKRK